MNAATDASNCALGPAGKTCKACGHVAAKAESLPVHSYVPALSGRFFTCPQCGSESVDGDVDYDKLYASRDSSNYPATNGLLVALKKALLRRTAAGILRGCDPGGSVLDFGCGGGELANAICAIGFSRVFAADVQAARPATLDARVSYLGVQALTEHGPFDVVILRHVIEHLEHPTEVLFGIREQLSPQGVMIVEFPSAASFWKRLMGPRWTGYFFPYHTMVLSDTGARRIFEEARLRVLATRLAEPPIFGVFLISLGMPRPAARIFSGLLFPLQALVSKLTGRSEALVFKLSARKPGQ